MAAATATAPTVSPVPEQHTFIQSLLYHLLPGFVPAVIAVLVATKLPPMLSVIVAGTVGVSVTQLGLLYWLGWKRNARLSLEGIVLWRERVSLGQGVLIVLGAIVAAGLITALLGPTLNGLLTPFFKWMPAGINPTPDDFTTYSKGLLWITFVLGLVGTSWVAPAVEELYFRGFLLPRMSGLKGWAPLVNAALFAAYHFWSPWQVLLRTLSVSPLAYAVWWKRSIWLGIAIHCMLNTIGMLELLPLLLK